CSIAARTIPCRATRSTPTATRASSPSTPSTRSCRRGGSRDVPARLRWKGGSRLPPLLRVGEAVGGGGGLPAAPGILVADLDGVFADGEVGGQRPAPQVPRRFRLGRTVPATQRLGLVVAHVLGQHAR